MPGWGMDGGTFFNETMSIYHLLYFTEDVPEQSGVWIPNESLDPRTKSGRARDPLLDSFAAKFSGHCGLLEEACRRLKGKKLKKGDVGYQFQVFEQVPVQMIFWDADEDFSAQVQLLVDSKITDFVHIETTGCIVSDLLERLENGSRFSG